MKEKMKNIKMPSRYMLKKYYVTKCCKSSFNILFDEVDGESYQCHKCCCDCYIYDLELKKGLIKRKINNENRI